MLQYLLALAAASPLLLWPSFRFFCRSVVDFPFLLANLLFTLGRSATVLALRGGRTRFPEWTVALELAQGAAHMLMAKYGANIPIESNAKGFRQFYREEGLQQARASCRDHQTKLERITVNGLEHLWIRADDSGPPHDPVSDKYVIMFCHGGAFTIGCAEKYIDLMNRLRRVIQNAVKAQTGTSIQVEACSINYRKAPEVQYPVPQEDVLLMFEYLRDHEGIKPDHLIVAGDSAGGGLIMSTLLRLRDQRSNATQPLAAVLLYPWVDLTDDPNPTRGEHCILGRPLLKASVEALFPTSHDDPSTWKDASSVDCDLHGLAPALIQVGTADYLYQDSLKLFARAEKDNVKGWELDARPNIPHGFVSFPDSIIPDVVPAINRMGEFVVKQIIASKAAKQ